MKILTGAQMKAFDQKAIEEHKIPSLILMENAGRSIAEVMAEEIDGIEDAQILALCGKGNNGGDGLCAARHLINMGLAVEIFVVGNRDGLSEESARQVEMLEGSGEQIQFIDSEDALEELESSLIFADLVIDGLLGIGVKGEPRGLLKPAIELVNSGDALIIAVDVPSGVDTDTGHVTNQTAIMADLTITLEFPKLGLLLYPGSEYAGDLLVTPIGYPQELSNEAEYEALLIEEELAQMLMPLRTAYSHKGTYGRLMLIAGSRGLSGAALMAGEAALRSGIGLLYMGFPESLSGIIECGLWEAVKLPLPEENGALSKTAAALIAEYIGQYRIDVLAIGPGLSQFDSIKELIRNLIPGVEVPLVIDADGLNALADADGLRLLKSLKAPAVITPHPGEFANLSGKSAEEIENDRVGTARAFAIEYGAIVVLKGVPTVIATPKGVVYLNTTGNSGLATGGSGDVLTGMIAGLMTQGLSSQFAAPVAVYLHGLLADRLSEETGERAMLPRDLLDVMPDVMREYE